MGCRKRDHNLENSPFSLRNMLTRIEACAWVEKRENVLDQVLVQVVGVQGKLSLALRPAGTP